MKYKVDLMYKGLTIEGNITGECKPGKIDIPGNIEVHIEGELKPIETFLYFRQLNKILKLIK